MSSSFVGSILILTVHSLHGPQGLDYPSADSSCLVGLCTGTLAAAAVSSARSLSDLLELAVQATIIAFKAGLCTWDISRSIFCDQSNHGRPWAFAVSGLSVEQASQAVKDFSEEEVNDAKNHIGRSLTVSS